MNAIRHNRIGVVENPDGSIDIVVPQGIVEEFKKLVMRGTNCYPNKHVEIMDFADRLLGRESYSGACMKQEIYGYPVYTKQAQIVTATPEEVKTNSENLKSNCEGHPETCNCDYHCR